MIQNRPRRPVATRLNTLAACLAAVLAAGGAPHGVAAPTPVGDSHPLRFNANVRKDAAPRFQRATNRWLHDIRPRSAKTGPAHPAVTHTVTNCDDAGPGSLRQAVADAATGDVIDMTGLAACTITLASGEISVPVPNLDIRGPGQDVVTVDGGDISRIFASGYAMSIRDLTIAHGHNDVGGCLFVDDDLTLTRTTITGCAGGDGVNAVSYGAGAFVGGDLVMMSSNISGNIGQALAGALGGGIYVGGEATISYSTISNNVASANSGSAGGGIFAKGDVHATETSVLANSAISTGSSAYGGGIFSNGTAIVLSQASIVRGNLAHSETYWSYGGGVQGGIYGEGSDITVMNSTLSGNTASSNCTTCSAMGGGAGGFGVITASYSTISDNQALSTSIAVGGGLGTSAYGIAGAIAILNSTVSGNTAQGGGGSFGGGLAAVISPFFVSNSTIAFNEAGSFGGGMTGIASGVTAPQLDSSIVASNQAPEGSDIASSGDPFTVTGTHSFVMIAGDGVVLPADTIAVDPLLLPLMHNGGATKTHALAPCSLAVDAGSNGSALLTDQRSGVYARENGIAADVGAFELQPDPERIFFGDFERPLCP